MAAPVNIKQGQGTFTSSSGSGSLGHGIGAQSDVLQIPDSGDHIAFSAGLGGIATNGNGAGAVGRVRFSWT